jgi:hypothetical protein
MPIFMTFLLRFFLVAASLVLAAGVAMAAAVLLVLWGLRSAWARLTGRPIMPFIIRMRPPGAFERVFRAAAQARRSQEAGRPARSVSDVTDVEIKR